MTPWINEDLSNAHSDVSHALALLGPKGPASEALKDALAAIEAADVALEQEQSK